MSWKEIIDNEIERKIKRELRRESAKLERERREILKEINALRKSLIQLR